LSHFNTEKHHNNKKYATSIKHRFISKKKVISQNQSKHQHVYQPNGCRELNENAKVSIQNALACLSSLFSQK